MEFVSLFVLLVVNLWGVECRTAEQQRAVSSFTSKLAELINGNIASPSTKVNSDDIPEELKDAKHGVVMGVISDSCDNGKDNLAQDWDGSPVNHTCFTSKYPLVLKKGVEPIITCDTLPPGNYSPPHFCMDKPVHYTSLIPTYEGHRPLWPIFGEYEFVPPQRWLHNIEHGAIVLLYHPCAPTAEVIKLKKLVKSCLWKYVITPWNMLPRDKPFALVAWTCRLQMATVDPGIVRYFIRTKAFRGPEGHYLKQGQYSVGLIEASQPPTDPQRDKVHC